MNELNESSALFGFTVRSREYAALGYTKCEDPRSPGRLAYLSDVYVGISTKIVLFSIVN